MKNTSKTVITNSIYYTFGKMLPMVVSFFMVPIYTKYLLPAEYGIVNSMQVLSTIFMIIFTLSIETSLFRLYYDYKDENKKRIFIGSAFVLIVISTTVGTAVLFIFKSTIEKIYTDIPFAPYYILAIVSMYLSIFAIVPRIIFVITEKGKTYFFIGLIQLIIALILNIVYIVILDQKAIGALTALLLTNLIMLPVYTYFQFKYSKITLDLKMVRAILTFSLPLLPASLSSWIINSSNRIFIDRYFSQSEVGIFSLGFRITFAYIVIITSIRMAYNPQYFKLASSDDQSYAKTKLQSYNYYYLIISILACFLVTFFAKELIGLFLNYQYFEAWLILVILTYANLFLESSGIFRMALSQKKETTILSAIVIITGLINLLLNWLIIPKWGMYGAGIATLFSGIIIFFSSYFASIKWGYHIKSKWIMVTILLFMGITINLIFWQLNISLLTLLILKIIFLTVCVTFIYLKYSNTIHFHIKSFRSED